MTDKLKELLPCPFCGGTPKRSREMLDERFSYADQVCYRCETCHVTRCATGDRSKAGYADNSTVEERAVKHWNSRAPLPAVEAAEIEVVAYLTTAVKPRESKRHTHLSTDKQTADDWGMHWRLRGCNADCNALMTVAQHRRILAGVNQQAWSGVPEGWKLVPVEPTSEMILAMQAKIREVGGFIAGHTATYRAAIGAAPLPASPAAKAGEA